ncbi:DUF6602 domain-containing protein [Acinetobacter sp.]|uniref:DUF6602 domain-containing protein n=1 Tax=Acinetobacter sp. TaxID=472 RepID=UPI002488DE48|nr:DUF6602 domain-containing protein [Acinetobacter sp.]MDI1225219.1 hypothetical protein [Acinetobacter sp.]
MEITKVFELISKKMSVDFELSAGFKHNGLRGDHREDVLRKFLCEGRLPKQYAIGNGEIISSYSQTSKQTDLIIYDSNKSIIFEATSTLQIFPIESVYGVIEVKSKLSKAKLIEGLDNIKSIKEIYTSTTVTKKLGKLAAASYHTNPPFGVIFAYDLGGNSLDSLRVNLSEWCRNNPPKVWPNLICILNKGIIRFSEGLKQALHSSDINDNCQISALHFNDESLFEFTSSLITLCTNREIEVFDLHNYKDNGIIIDNLRVKGANGFKDRNNGNDLRFTDAFIKEIYETCKKPIQYKELIFLTIGDQKHLEPFFADRTDPVYLYNPKNYPGMGKFSQYNVDELLTHIQNTPNITSGHHIYINDNTYYIPYAYFEDNHFQPI